MKIAIDLGHGVGLDRGAKGYIDEEKIIREYGGLVIEGLKKLGYDAYNVTPTLPNLTLSQSLTYRVKAANEYKADLYISCHVNAYEWDKALGCEVLYVSDSGKVYADKICGEIAKLGFINRGSKKREELYVLRCTNMPAVLVEPFFCDNKSDCNLYNPKKIANAIIKGITNKEAYKDTTSVPNIKYPQIDHSIPKGTDIIPFAGNFGYIQSLPQRGRLDIHLDKYNYITIQDDEKEGNRIIITTRTKGSKVIL